MPVDRRDPDAGHDRAQDELDVLDPVLHQHGDVVVGLQPGFFAEESRDADAAVAKLCPGAAAAQVVDGQAVGVVCGEIEDHERGAA